MVDPYLRAGLASSLGCGFLQGAWPFGAVKAIWAGVAVWRWRGKALRPEPR